MKKAFHKNPWISPLLMALPILLILAIFYFWPMLKMIPVSFQVDGQFSFANYTRILTEPTYLKSFGLTILIGIGAVVITFVMGYPVAYLMATGKPRTQKILMILIMLSFWTSLMVRTYSWMVVLQKNGIINSLLLKTHIIDQALTLLYTPIAILIGTVHILLPYMVLPINSTLRGIDSNLAWAARSMGASHMQANIKVILPLVKPALFTSILFAFVTSFDESVISLFITDRTTITLPRMIFNSLRFEISPAISAISTVLIAVTVLVFMANTVLENSSKKLK